MVYEMGAKLENKEIDAQLMECLRDYEMRATSIGLWLLHRMKIRSLDQWASDIWHWDWDYISRIYLEGAAINPIRSYAGEAIPYGQPVLEPHPVPLGFVPQQMCKQRRVI